MNPVGHLVVSAAVGGGMWAATGEINTLPAAVGAGFLPDVDHLLDYFNWYVRRSHRLIIVFLHSWELVVLGALVYAFAVRESWMLAVVLGYTSHMFFDQVVNRGYPFGYFLLARMRVRFIARRVHPWDQTRAYENLLRTLPPFVRPLLERWFRSRVESE